VFSLVSIQTTHDRVTTHFGDLSEGEEDEVGQELWCRIHLGPGMDNVVLTEINDLAIHWIDGVMVGVKLLNRQRRKRY
jgi:hypothetical protein